MARGSPSTIELGAHKEEIYLDNASTSFPKPASVCTSVVEFARRIGASPGRGAYPRALSAGDVLAECRARMATLLGVSQPASVAFASNSTEALNWALKGLLSRTGDHVVVTALEHNAVLRPVMALALARGTTYSVVPCGRDGTVGPSAIEAAIRPETKLVCAVHASNVLGTILPVAEIASVAHEHGLPVLVDGSQTAGAVPIALETWGIDLFAFTGHKSLLGPTGTGGLYIRPGTRLATWKEGGTGTQSESLEHPSDMPERMEAGTPNMWGISGLLGSLMAIEEMGISWIRQHEQRLSARLYAALADLPGVLVYGPHEAARRTGIVSANVQGLPPAEVGRLLGERYGIAVRAGLHCSPWRTS